MTWKKISFDIYDQHVSGDHKNCFPGSSLYWNSCSEKLTQLQQQHANGNHEECKDVPTTNGTTWDACSYKYIKNLHNYGEHSQCEDSCPSKIPQMHERKKHEKCTSDWCGVKANEERHELGDHRLCIPYENYYSDDGWLNCKWKATINFRKHRNNNHESCLPGSGRRWDDCHDKRTKIHHDADNHIFCYNCDVVKKRRYDHHNSGDHTYCHFNLNDPYSCSMVVWEDFLKEAEL